jgi:hypothetical protein
MEKKSRTAIILRQKVFFRVVFTVQTLKTKDVLEISAIKTLDRQK